jgi:hypothetical protein
MKMYNLLSLHPLVGMKLERMEKKLIELSFQN